MPQRLYFALVIIYFFCSKHNDYLIFPSGELRWLSQFSVTDDFQIYKHDFHASADNENGPTIV